MKAHSRREGVRLAAVLPGLVLLAVIFTALAAGAPGLRSQVAGLRADSGSLEARAKAATLELYALQTELGRAQAELDRVAARRARVAEERAAARAQLVIAQRAVRVSEARLADLVRALYERPDHKDPLAILLGARSLEEALTGLDNLDRAADENQRIIEQATTARAKLRRLDARLAARDAELTRLAAAAKARASQLAAASAERTRFVDGLKRQQGLNAARIASIENQVRAAEARTIAISPAPAPAAASTAPVVAAEADVSAALEAPAPSGARTLTVSATGYALRGLTATGVPTAPGVVAVDPSVIPLGTRMTIPGYGEGVAADTGGVVHGTIIDLWFPTTAQALAWGRRTVTITIH